MRRQPHRIWYSPLRNLRSTVGAMTAASAASGLGTNMVSVAPRWEKWTLTDGGVGPKPKGPARKVAVKRVGLPGCRVPGCHRSCLLCWSHSPSGAALSSAGWEAVAGLGAAGMLTVSATSDRPALSWGLGATSRVSVPTNSFTFQLGTITSALSLKSATAYENSRTGAATPAGRSTENPSPPPPGPPGGGRPAIAAATPPVAAGM
mmetsp:Transcript_33417/g.106554  ORF Transcript_33417/g.106554 Transcript_33417/m.106554 type:complete len:205 (+) Transcript_33417:98-712(+)